MSLVGISSVSSESDDVIRNVGVDVQAGEQRN
jgi:hypothetical protein